MVMMPPDKRANKGKKRYSDENGVDENGTDSRASKRAKVTDPPADTHTLKQTSRSDPFDFKRASYR